MAMKLGNPELARYHAQIDPLVEMAQVGPGSSILDLRRGNAVVTLVAKAITGPGDQPIVGIDNSHGMLQAAQQLWENREQIRGIPNTISIPNTIRLYHGEVRDLDAIGKLPEQLGFQLKFDHRFARNVIRSPEPEESIATLQHWAKCKTLGTGKITMTYGLLMIEAEWVRGEEEFRKFVTRAGLRLQDVQRVGFESEDSAAWQEVGQDYELHAHRRHAHVGAKGDLELGWSNAAGSFSIAFKLQLKMEALEELPEEIDNEIEARGFGTAGVVI
ncbi:MAG: hypothetical protein Q9181_007292 [Wetmoreana brouardii]